MDNPEFDLIAIGDLATDAFIRIKEADVHCDDNQENCTISMRFGDKIPYESVTVIPAVGNSSNAAVAATRLGLKAALVSNLGRDHDGEEALAALSKNGVETKFVKQHADKKTNYHYVLWYKDDRTILIKHEEYPYSLPDIGNPKWIYLSSLSENSLDFQHRLGEYLASHPEVKLAFQPGTFQIKASDQLSDLYQHTEICFCNFDEAQRILKTTEEEVSKLLSGLSALGPKMVVITDGPRGAYAYQKASGEEWFMPPYPDPKPPFERTGAGDAFSSTITAALALGLPLTEALRWGPVNSMSVVQQVGAQAGLLSRPELEKFLAQAPADYQLRKNN